MNRPSMRVYINIVCMRSLNVFRDNIESIHIPCERIRNLSKRKNVQTPNEKKRLNTFTVNERSE